MDKPDREPPPPAADHLNQVTSDSRGIRGIVPIGVCLILAILVLTLFAPNVLWLLLYPALIIAAVGVLTLGAALLLRHL